MGNYIYIYTAINGDFNKEHDALEYIVERRGILQKNTPIYK